jgi:hypothetical protein
MRLRRRLSKIFHLDSADSLFLVNLPFAAGMKGIIHDPICQSPRTHR